MKIECRVEEIKDIFGERVATLVTACTFDRNIKDYKERWRNLISNIKRAGRDALIIKLADQIENLPYYMLISDDQKEKEVMWKHNYFIDACRDDLQTMSMFKKYERMVSSYQTIK